MTTLDTLHRILKKDFDLEPEAVQLDTRLEALEIDSLTVVEVLFAVEDEFKVKVPQEPAAREADRPALARRPCTPRGRASR